MKSLIILENRSELGAGTRGSGMGIDGLRVAAYNSKSLYFAKNECIEIPNLNHLLTELKGGDFVKRISGIVEIYERISTAVSQALLNEKFPVVLAGDHSNAGGTIAGIKRAFPNLQLGIVWIDAHADLHTPFTTPSGNVHGMPLATALAEDNLECAVKNRKIPEADLQGWNELKKMGGAATPSENLVFIGLRDTEKEEEMLIERRRIKFIQVAELRKNGAAKIARKTLDYLDHCDLIYVSFDVDSLDSSISKGTGTPVSGGFLTDELAELLKTLVKSSKVKCFELTEINPALDNRNLMAETAFSILEQVTNQIKRTHGIN